jgi:hypothetical protein
MSSLQHSKDFVAISINDSSRSYPPSKRSYTATSVAATLLLDPQTENWFCTRSNVSLFRVHI